jgi:hypothetical protein
MLIIKIKVKKIKNFVQMFKSPVYTILKLLKLKHKKQKNYVNKNLW